MTLTASQLSMTQSSVSQIISNLENNLNMKLLDRSVRPIELTVAGRYFYDQSCHLLTQAEKTYNVMSKGDFQRLHLLRISMADSLVTSLAPSLVDTIEHHTESWTISTGRSHMHAQALLSRKVDIIISDDALEDNDFLCRHRILREPFILVIPRRETRQFTSFQQLNRELNFICYTSDSLIGATIERYLRRQGVLAPIRLQLDNTFALLSSVSAGLGWTITTPLCLFQSGLLRDQLTCLPLPSDELLQRNLTLISRHNELGNLPKILAAESRQVIHDKFLANVLSKLPWLEKNLHVG